MDRVADRFGLSEEQQMILQQGSLSVVACPGAGKTRAIVARFWQSTQQLQHGVALLSFTNRAVDEAMRRCGSSPELFKAPNFVGTFDSFLHRFIVTPAVTKELGHAPLYVPSWDKFPGKTNVRSWRVSGGSGIDLSSFSWTPAGASLSRDALKWDEKAYYDEVVKKNDEVNLLNSASKLLNTLFKSGIMDSASARFLAFRTLKAPGGEKLASRLATRFQEVIVDEFQDCDKNEHEVLRILISNGMRAVLVSDPDQSIYDFRGENPGKFDIYRTGTHIPELRFTVNYRSTPVICAVASSLRSERMGPISPSPEPPLGPGHVYLVEGRPGYQRAQFVSLLDRSGIPRSEAIVLAHMRLEAMLVAGGASTDVTRNGKCDVLVRTCAVLDSPRATPRDRSDALRSIEGLVLSCFAWPAELQTSAVNHQLSALGRSKEWLRLVSAKLYRMASGIQTRDEFSAAVRAFLANELTGHQIPLIKLSNVFTKPGEDAWEFVRISDRDHQNMLPFNSIHGAKGSEFPAVMLVVSSRSGQNAVDNWEKSIDSEARRVLYVGATRAEKLLALAVPSKRTAQVISILRRDAIPFDLLTEQG